MDEQHSEHAGHHAHPEPAPTVARHEGHPPVTPGAAPAAPLRPEVMDHAAVGHGAHVALASLIDTAALCVYDGLDTGRL